MALQIDNWLSPNPRSISTFHTFSRGGVPTVHKDSITTRAGNPPDMIPVVLPPMLSPDEFTANSDYKTTNGIKPLSFGFDEPADNDDDHFYDQVSHELEVPYEDITIVLADGDHRFGFSVTGGSDEGFSPQIDEVTPCSPADKADLEVGDEILEVNGRSLENATHTEVISHIHQCIKSRTICLRVKRKTGNKLALDLAQNSNVQDAFVIAVEQQARERLEKLSALQKIKPVDMTKLSQQLSQESSSSSQELNGIIDGSPIYVTSVPNLSQSTGNIKTAVESKGVVSKPHHSSAGDCKFLGANGFVNDSEGRGADEEIELKQDLSDENLQESKPKEEAQLTSVLKSSGRSTSSGGLLSADTLGKPEVSSIQVPKHRAHESSDSGSSSPSFSTSRDQPGNGVRASAVVKSLERSVGGSRSLSNVDKMKERREGGSGPGAGNGTATPHREMAVDVPDTFIGSLKAPPRYPPPKGSGRSLGSDSSGSGRAAGSPSRLAVPAGASQGRENGKLLSKTGSGGSSSGATGSGSSGKVNSQKPKSKEGSVFIGVKVLPPLPQQQDGSVMRATEPATKDGNASAGNGVAPKPVARTVPSSIKDNDLPTEMQMDRIRKYQEDLRKRREEEERIEREQEFLRNSLRGSKKLQALEQNPTPQPASGFVNTAFESEDSDDGQGTHLRELESGQTPTPLKRSVGPGELITALQGIQTYLRTKGHTIDNEDLTTVETLLRNPDFQQALQLHNKVQKLWCYQTPPSPRCADAQELTQEVLNLLHDSTLQEASELVDLLNKYDFEGLIFAHDKIAEREVVAAMSPDEELLDRASHYTEDSVKIVRIEKSNEPLGATVRNEGEAVVIGRIVKGGAAEKSGLLHEGDEVLEVNGIEMRGKSVNDVCDILAGMTGTLTFLIVPSHYEQNKSPARDTVMHVKAHFDYDPEDDIYIPCRELGISFMKGNILHVINQEDPNWWQAYREGDEDQTLAGLIPSKSFQQQREAMKQTIVGDSNNKEKSKRGTLLCAKKTAKKKKKKVLYNANYNDDFDAEEILTYEEVTLYYPRANRKRPIVLIGPPNIGRHELRQNLMEDVERFAAAVPHTSRPKKDEELDGQDYYFITRQQFEADIANRKFVEHGEYEKNYYGTSLDAIRTVVNSGKICVLNLHPQSLKILKASDLKPFVVYIAPPSLEKLRQNKAKLGSANSKDDDLKDIIEKAREMEENYGHYFDLVIVNSDIERAYNQLLHEINILEREPQWVPAAWLQNEIN